MSSETHPAPGESLTATFTVLHTDLASVSSPDSSDTYPAVFATPRMINFMEITAARMVAPILKPGQLSVGAVVDVVHLKPTPPGETVQVTATFKGIEKKLWLFDVVCRDAKGDVGRGQHSRGIVQQAKLEAAAAKRRASKL